MTQHRPEERIKTIMDVSQFNEYYKMSKIATEGMREEVDKGVVLAGGKLPDKRINTQGDRRKQ